MNEQKKPQMERHLGTGGAMLLGLGAMLGSGIFVSASLATEVAGVGVIGATLVAAVLATLNALNSAQLAASHPVSGGAYEYGYRYATPFLGFTAGWLFLIAKSASAATAVLGCSAYLVNLGVPGGEGARGLAVVVLVVMTLLGLSGVRRANWANIVVVGLTLLALSWFVLAGLQVLFDRESPSEMLTSSSGGTAQSFLQATALMFVAYTGYGRIATMGEEVRNPRQIIPRAIISTLVFTGVLYTVVVTVAVATVGAEAFGQTTGVGVAPLAEISSAFAGDTTGWAIALGAAISLLGVSFNLILGLSRVVLAMARRGDVPAILSQLNTARTSPVYAVLAVSGLILILVIIADIRIAWSLSAFTVLSYYGINNFCALRLPQEYRLYSRIIAWAGLGGCFFLAFWVEPRIWLVGGALIVIGGIWHGIARRRQA